MQRNWTLDRVMRYVLIAVAVGVSLYVLNYLRGVLFPFFAAFLIAYIMDPLVCWLQIKFRYRVIAVIVVILACAVIIGRANSSNVSPEEETIQGRSATL